MTQTIRKTTTLFLALLLAGVAVGRGVAQTAPASIVIADMPQWVAAGTTASFTVTVVDGAGAPVADYAGTVRFSASSTEAAVPEDYTFGPDDAGSHRFEFTPRRTGPLTIAVWDPSAGVRGWERTTVAPLRGADYAHPMRGASTVARLPAAPHDRASDADGARPGRVSAANPPASHMYVVAHQDDDLLFMNPDVEESIKSGARVRTVYVTAAGSATTWQDRENGILNAYPAMANLASDWTCVFQTHGKALRVCTLNPQPLVSVVFLRLPDGGVASLWARENGPPFYVDPVASLTTADSANVYTRDDVIDVLTALIADFAPDRIGIHDATLAYGADHPDHYASALFAAEAERVYSAPHHLRMYRGYNQHIWWEPVVPSPEVPNLSPAQHAEKVRIMRAYGDPMPVDSPWDRFCWRRYAVSRLFGGTGVLAGPGGQCIGVAGGEVAAVPCADGVQGWTLNANGQIQAAGAVVEAITAPEPAGTRAQQAYAADPRPQRNPFVGPPIAVGGACLGVASNGTLDLGACTAAPGQIWTVLSNGQVRSQEGNCVTLGDDGTSLRVALCTADTSAEKFRPVDAQHWVQRMGPVEAWSGQFSDAELGSPVAYAGSFRLGDVTGDGYADACARLSAGLVCAPNDRLGGFSPHVLYSAAFSDAAGWLPAAYGSTLQLADVNHDGKADVCGRSASGIVCATANAEGTAMGTARVWSAGTEFSDAQGWGASAAYYGSIRLGDVNGDGYADVCGRTSTVVVCALNDRAGRFAASGQWIADFADASGWQALPYGTTLQLGDVNGDGKADVCGRASAGLRCATANAAGTAFVDAHQWSLRDDFSDAAGWSAGAGAYGSLRLADVNDDGMDDVCGRGQGGVVCAFSNGAAFDVALAVLPHGYTDASGWSSAPYGATIQLGDLDQDGRRDVCGRGPAGLVCAKAP